STRGGRSASAWGIRRNHALADKEVSRRNVRCLRNSNASCELSAYERRSVSRFHFFLSVTVLIYGDVACNKSAVSLVRDIGDHLRRSDAAQTFIARHASLVRAWLHAAELFQGVADEQFRRR